MSLVLDTGAMKYRESPSQPWRPLVIKAGMNWESMADTYDPDNGTYEVGQYVLEEGMMYRCIYEITTPEAWTPAHWTSANVADELASFIIISDDQPTEDSNKIWIAETTSPFGVQIPTMDDHNALGNTLNQLESEIGIVVDGKSCTLGASQGQYVILKNSTISGKSDGLYTAAQAIPAGEQNVTAAMLTGPISCGGLNSLKNTFAPTVSNLTTGTTVNIKYVKSGNVVTATSDSMAKIDMNAATSYVVDAAMVWPPYNRQSFEALCRNGVAAYFDLDPSSQNQFTITPRASIAKNASMAFSFSYITSA